MIGAEAKTAQLLMLRSCNEWSPQHTQKMSGPRTDRQTVDASDQLQARSYPAVERGLTCCMAWLPVIAPRECTYGSLCSSAYRRDEGSLPWHWRRTCRSPSVALHLSAFTSRFVFRDMTCSA